VFNVVVCLQEAATSWIHFGMLNHNKSQKQGTHPTPKINLHGIEHQFGGMPTKGCADGLFCIKSLLHMRHQHNLPLYIMFVDLVKAYDTVNHELLFQILERYGAPNKYVDAIRRLYSSLIAKISIGTEKAEISQTVGVRQGDNLSPVIFLFLMSACAKSMQHELDARGMERAKCRKVNLAEISSGQLIAHKPKNFKAGEEFKLFDFYYVDDGAFVFTTRESLME
jgi:hypothetical protein